MQWNIEECSSQISDDHRSIQARVPERPPDFFTALHQLTGANMDYTVHVHMHTNELIIIRFMDLSDYSSGHENSITMLLYRVKADIRLWEIGWTHRVFCPIFIFICSIYEVNLVPFVLLCLHVWKNVNADLYSVYIHNVKKQISHQDDLTGRDVTVSDVFIVTF